MISWPPFTTRAVHVKFKTTRELTLCGACEEKCPEPSPWKVVESPDECGITEGFPGEHCGQAAEEVSPDGFAWGCCGSALEEPSLVALASSDFKLCLRESVGPPGNTQPCRLRYDQKQPVQ